MQNLSQNKKISLGFGVVLIISLFFPWFRYVINVSLIDIPDYDHWFPEKIPFKIQLAVYIGYVYVVLAAAGLYFNYKNDIQKAILSYYAMVGYFALVIILNILDMGDVGGGGDRPSIFKVLGMGFYVFIASYIGNLKYLKEDSESEIIEE